MFAMWPQDNSFEWFARLIREISARQQVCVYTPFPFLHPGYFLRFHAFATFSTVIGQNFLREQHPRAETRRLEYRSTCMIHGRLGRKNRATIGRCELEKKLCAYLLAYTGSENHSKVVGLLSRWENRLSNFTLRDDLHIGGGSCLTTCSSTHRRCSPRHACANKGLHNPSHTTEPTHVSVCDAARTREKVCVPRVATAADTLIDTRLPAER